MKIVSFFHILYYTYVTADIKIKILHTADADSRFDEISENTGECTSKLKERGKCLGGFPRIATILKQVPKDDADAIVLYLFGGGIFLGTLWYKVHEWKICADMLNALNPDAVALSHQEFEVGTDKLKNYVDDLNAPVLAANIDVSNVPELKDKIKPFTILEKKGVKIGIIGHTSRVALQQVADLDKRITYSDEVASVKKYADELSMQGVKIIISLGNSGLAVDKYIALRVPKITAVVGGRDKIFFWNGAPPSIEEPLDIYPMLVIGPDNRMVPIVHIYAYSKYLGCLNLTLNENGHMLSRSGHPFFLDNSVEQDPKVVKVLERFRKGVKEAEKEQIGETRVILEGTNDVCGKEECSLGNLITDAYVEYDVVKLLGPFWTTTPIGLLHAGAMVHSIDPRKNEGKIRRCDLSEAYPLDSQIASFSVTGKVLRATFEASVKRDFSEREGEFLQVSGIRVRYDMTRTSGSRVVSLEARCGQCEIPIFEDVIDSAYYNVVGPYLLVTEQSIFRELKTQHTIITVYQEVNADIVTDYIRKHTPICTGKKKQIIIDSENQQSSRGNTVYVTTNNIITIFVNILCTKIPF